MGAVSGEKLNKIGFGDTNLTKEHLQKIVDSSIDIICTIDIEGKFIWLNKACEAVWGYTPIELIGKKYMDLVVEDDRLKTMNVANAIMNGTNFTNFENHYHHKNGSVVPMVWSAAWDNDLEVMNCVAKDATEKKKAERELGNRNFLLRNALKVANMGTWEYDVITQKAYWSDELYEIYGLSNNINAGDLFEIFNKHVHPDDKHLIEYQLKNVDNLKSNFVHRFIRPDGKTIYLNQCVSNLQNKDGIVIKIAGLAQEVTETKEYEEQLHLREKRFQSLMKTGSDIIGIIDSVGNYLYASENTKTILGYDPQFFLGKNAFDFIHPDDAPYVYSSLATIALEKYAEIKAFRFKNAAGEWRWIETKVSNLLDDPSIEGIVVNSRDVTDKKIIEDKLARLSKIAEETDNAVIITDKNGIITWVNTAFEKITGFNANEVFSKKPGDFLQGPGSDLSVIAKMRESIKKGEAFDVEIINYTKDKKPYWMHIQCQPQYDNNGALYSFFAIQTNITQRKQLEHQLQNEVAQRQKRITSAIINAQEKERSELSKELHDNVNQILTTVKLYLEMVEGGAENSNDLVTKAKTYLVQSINEIRQITKLLAAPEQLHIKLEESINDLVDSLSIAGNIKFNYVQYGMDKYIPCEEISLTVYRIAQEHLTNIVKHAKASKVKISLSMIAGNLSLVIVDNGIGFDVAKKRKGIGISNMYNRVETINGRLDIKSKEGEGCTLVAVLPVNKL